MLLVIYRAILLAVPYLIVAIAMFIAIVFLLIKLVEIKFQ